MSFRSKYSYRLFWTNLYWTMISESWNFLNAKSDVPKFGIQTVVRRENKIVWILQQPEITENWHDGKKLWYRFKVELCFEFTIFQIAVCERRCFVTSLAFSFWFGLKFKFSVEFCLCEGGNSVKEKRSIRFWPRTLLGARCSDDKLFGVKNFLCVS